MFIHCLLGAFNVYWECMAFMFPDVSMEEHNGGYFADDIIKSIFVKEN